MGSQISEILSAYQRSLKETYEDYKKMYRSRANNAFCFYRDFLKSHIRHFKNILESDQGKRFLKTKMDEFFGTIELPFIAIDGSCHKEPMSDFMVFFAASYAARGKLSLLGEPPSIKYERWSTEQDTSMIAYVPIPFAQFSEITEEKFFYYSDLDKVNLSNIDIQLMQLAEIYLAYDLAKATPKPKIILLDNSLSSILLSTDVVHLLRGERLGIIGYRYRDLTLTAQDVFIAYSQPHNYELGIPTDKGFHGEYFVLANLARNEKVNNINLSNSKIKDDKHLKRLKNITDTEDSARKKRIITEDSFKENIKLERGMSILNSWEFTKRMFEYIGYKLFREKDPMALTFEKKDEDGKTRRFWMTPDDLRFLVAVGLRALIEICWRNNILLIGIVKDSSSKYFSKNYLGVLRHCEVFQFSDIVLPWADRIFLELLPYFDDTLHAPWATIEFDSTFMTLRLILDEVTSQSKIEGVRGEVIAPERLFLRSLVQFFLSRDKKDLLSGHVIFVDRLAYSQFDKINVGSTIIKTARGDEIQPVLYLDAGKSNIAQDITIYILSVLTRNLFPEVIGYPDPLHKADWGAKSLKEKIKPLIESSNITFKSDPLRKLFRQIREEIRRI